MIWDASESSVRWPVLAALAMLILAGTYFRVWGLWAFYWTPDEALVLLISSKPTIQQVLDAAIYHPHPPLRYIVLHFMLKLSVSPVILRSIAFLPGVAMIPLFFFVGRRTAGTAAGLVMATIATFSHAAIMLSQVMRTYMLGTFLISLGVLSFFEYWQERKKRHLFLWCISMTLALLSHYFAILVAISVGSVWLHRIYASRPRRTEFIRAVWANVPIAIVAAVSYVIHLSSRNPYRWWINIDKERLVAEFPDSFSDFVINAVRLFGYLFLSPHALWAILLTVVGVAALWAMKRKDVASVIILTFVATIALTLSDRYPFGGGRQSFYLLPFVSMSIGAALQFAWNWVRSSFDGSTNSGSARRVSNRREYVSHLLLALFLFVFVSTSFVIAQRDYERYRYGRGSGELPVTRDDVYALMQHLKEHVGRGDVVLADGQSMAYAQLAAGHPPEPISGTVSKIQFEGLEFLYSNRNYSFSFNSEETLWRSFEDLFGHTEIWDGATIWVVSIGWQPIKRVLGSGICGPPMVSAWEHGGASVFGFRGSAVAEQIKRRYGDGVDD